MTLSKLRNIGIIAHVDAGKTTVTERILFYSGSRHKVGDVHHGTTTTDFSPEERKRGITIYSAATSVFWKQHKLNVIDTPGHVDFNIEVKRSLRVLDGAVVVFDAVSGVEPQSETNWRLADDYEVPRICFVNKMDRTGADYFKTIDMIQKQLGANAVALQLPVGSEDQFSGVIDLLSQVYYRWPEDNGAMQPFEISEIPESMQAEVRHHRNRLVESIVEGDDTLLAAWLDGETIDEASLRKTLRQLTLSGQRVPVLCGTAFKNKGVEALLDAVVDYLPSPGDRAEIKGIAIDSEKEETRYADNEDAFSALAFKVVNDRHGSLTFVRVYSGCLESGAMVLNSQTGRRERIGRIYEIQADKHEPREQLGAGDIVALAGLNATTTGHTLCAVDQPLILESIQSPEPVIDIALEAVVSKDQEQLIKALQAYVAEDPSLRLGTDDETGQLILSGMGELQLEVSLNRLQDEHGIAVNVGQPGVAYRETLEKAHRIRYRFKKQDGGAGQFAELELLLEPLPRGEGVAFENRITGGAIPREFIPGVEKGIRAAVTSGPLNGAEVVDIRVTLVDGAFHAQDSSALAFERAALLACQQAFAEGQMCLLEPVMLVEVDTPLDYMGDCIGDLNRRRGSIREQQSKAQSVVLNAYAPLAEMFGYIGELRAMTSGRASFSMVFDHYAAAPR